MKWTFIAVMFASDALACHVVDGPRILGQDVASANSYFGALDPGLLVGASPLPGVQRVLHADELVRLARQNAIAPPTPAGEICFERATELLTGEKLLPVLRNALAIEGLNISIVDFSRYGVPRGTLEFTRAGLSAAGLWRGHVAYDGNRSMAVWVKVRATIDRTWVEAAQPLVSAKAIEAAQLFLRRGARFPFGPTPLSSIDAAAGRLPIRAIKAGEPIFASMLMAPREVERGDKVSVEVISGEARVLFDAAAETAGRLGELVLVRNPQNGKPFQARVDGKDKVAIRK
jgi:flagella basal body P-ring formation protein FlgA